MIRYHLQAMTGGYHWIEAHARPFVADEQGMDGRTSGLRLIDAQVSQEEELRRQAHTDQLTGLLTGTRRSVGWSG
ncbi:hypothetical protein [Synechococcus sp. CBW1107]|uniref:hypothetical protein n=1 Tax=Synechococcus sp. CBW1107 TaxID=2789857 RepID=UPI002AD48105|nr:hypothetical protein [Synechococcus sp. CBW1107]CAK6692711.1 hypothetical protein IFHNHDMJ_01273 [Synechococcus sp. CBW1107]